ncbi:ABC transporter [Penicillium taxi]|uniref:ABC transporter n=1 Tax=Penicillium taxi TaxID=168475 RepID=UPI002545525C|nr:ABC transporter [Penicillium taxi]KAJ5908187.1 ABC transporter [Penicillium taxi]
MSEKEALQPDSPKTESVPSKIPIAIIGGHGLSDASRKTGDLTLYNLYFQEMGLPYIISILATSIGFCFCSRFPSIWLKWWSNSEAEHIRDEDSRYMSGYAGFGLLAAIFFFMNYWVFMVKPVPLIVVRLHRRLLSAVVMAPLLYLTSIDNGVILNRFSQDMSLIDMRLPGLMVMTLDGALDIIAEGILIAQSSLWSALMYPLLRFYLHTSRQIRHLDLEAKSPLFSSFLETSKGITTIRAFGWQERSR